MAYFGTVLLSFLWQDSMILKKFWQNLQTKNVCKPHFLGDKLPSVVARWSLVLNLLEQIDLLTQPMIRWSLVLAICQPNRHPCTEPNQVGF